MNKSHLRSTWLRPLPGAIWRQPAESPLWTLRSSVKVEDFTLAGLPNHMDGRQNSIDLLNSYRNILC